MFFMLLYLLINKLIKQFIGLSNLRGIFVFLGQKTIFITTFSCIFCCIFHTFQAANVYFKGKILRASTSGTIIIAQTPTGTKTCDCFSSYLNFDQTTYLPMSNTAPNSRRWRVWWGIEKTSFDCDKTSRSTANFTHVFECFDVLVRVENKSCRENQDTRRSAFELIRRNPFGDLAELSGTDQPWRDGCSTPNPGNYGHI